MFCKKIFTKLSYFIKYQFSEQAADKTSVNALLFIFLTLEILCTKVPGPKITGSAQEADPVSFLFTAVTMLVVMNPTNQASAFSRNISLSTIHHKPCSGECDQQEAEKIDQAGTRAAGAWEGSAGRIHNLQFDLVLRNRTILISGSLHQAHPVL